MALNVKYGMGDLNRVKLSGPYRVGYRDFTPYKNMDVAIFYPAADDGSGSLGVPIFTYG